MIGLFCVLVGFGAVLNRNRLTWFGHSHRKDDNCVKVYEF